MIAHAVAKENTSAYLEESKVPKQGDVVILLANDLKTQINSFTKHTPSLEIFDTCTFAFLEALSKAFLREKAHSEIVALGFWLRRSHLLQIKERFLQKHHDELLFARGTVFHIAPSNVDTIFVYSLILSLLAGNYNIVRISERSNEQLERILTLFTSTLRSHPLVAQHITLVRYGYDDTITKKFSSLCDVRIIWGGDATIEHIRSIPIPATAIELTFADKFSFALIDMEKITLNDDFFERLYRDSFTFLQNACSSVRCICWINASREKKELFWERFGDFCAKKMPQIQTKQTIDKLTALTLLVAKEKKKIRYKNHIHRIAFEDIHELEYERHCGFGLFYEVDIDSLDTLFGYATRKNQTLCVAGISKEAIVTSMQKNRVQGFDRIVRLGEANSFAPIWDGYDILSSLVRVVDVDI